MQQSAAERFAALFSGYTKAHGQWVLGARDERGKVGGRAVTVAGPPKWEQHLSGTKGIGVIPLRDDNTLSFAAIDVDKYQLKIEQVAELVAASGLPLLVCQSKSGGVHMYTFMREPQEAREVREVLNDWAGWLGFGGSEIFPKQNYRESEQDIGNWINMPYFSGDQRRCFYQGRFLTPEEFLTVAEKLAAENSDLGKYEPKSQTGNNVDIPDLLDGCAPCMVKFHADGGVPDGHRHNTLYSVVVYCRKRWPDDWTIKVPQVCDTIGLKLDSRTIEETIRSLSKKSYDYECKGPWCNPKKCRKVRFGKGDTENTGTTCEINSITRVVGDPVFWIVDIEGTRVRVTTEQLYNQSQFNKLCMETIMRCPTTMPLPRWLKYLDDKLKSAETVESPADASPIGQFKELVEWFITAQNRRGQAIEEVLVGKPYHPEGADYIIFRPSGLYEFLDERRFKLKNQHEGWMYLRQLGADRTVVKIQGKTVNVWTLPLPKAEGLDDL